MAGTDSAPDDARLIVVSALKRCKPARIEVRMSDGEKRVLAVPENRKRWDHCASVLDTLQWERLYFLNAKGELIDSLDAEREETPGATARIALPQEYALLDLMIKAQSEGVLKFLGPLITSIVGTCERLVTGVQDRSDRYEVQIERLTQVLERVRLSGGGAPSDEDDAVEAQLAEEVGKVTGMPAPMVKVIRDAINGTSKKE